MRLADFLRAKGKGEAVSEAAEGETGRFSEREVLSIPMHRIRPNRFQPRKVFADESLQELVQSIKEHGLLQPIVVRPIADGYEVVAGERRLRACQELGWTVVPAVVRELDDEETAVLALVENLQREDLTLFEEVEGLQRLRDEFGLTQQEIAEYVGLSQAGVANKLRLLQLEPSVREKLIEAKLSERHARALLRLPTEELRLQALRLAVKHDWTVRRLEEWVREQVEASEEPVKRPGRRMQGIYKDARVFVNSVKSLVEQMAAGGVPIALEQVEAPGYIEVRVRIETGKEHEG